jgi:23S rRNA (adenine2503-C2)-methyltransferase
MSNLSRPLRDKLKEHYFIDKISLDDQQISADKTIKCAFSVGDGKVVEGVLIPTATRTTACISSQVGCSLSCTFCATGRLKLMRNLTPGEIVDQVVYLKNQAENRYRTPLTNIVYMGMGEPLLNYKNTLRSIEMITSPEGLGMSPKRITVSTAGIAKMIRKLGDDEVKFNLAVSLHSAIDEIRSKIMPFSENFPLADLRASLEYWYKKTKSKISFEYVVWKGINDNKESVDALVKFCKYVPCKVNLIEYNPIDDGEFQQASEESINAYIKALEATGIVVKVRRSRGKDIDAACGQLANKEA